MVHKLRTESEDQLNEIWQQKLRGYRYAINFMNAKNFQSEMDAERPLRILEILINHKDQLNKIIKMSEVVGSFDLSAARELLERENKMVLCSGNEKPVDNKCNQAKLYREARISFDLTERNLLSICEIENSSVGKVKVCAYKNFVSGKIVKYVEGSVPDIHEEKIKRRALQIINEVCRSEAEAILNNKEDISISDSTLVPVGKKQKEKPKGHKANRQ